MRAGHVGAAAGGGRRPASASRPGALGTRAWAEDLRCDHARRMHQPRHAIDPRSRRACRRLTAAAVQRSRSSGRPPSRGGRRESWSALGRLRRGTLSAQPSSRCPGGRTGVAAAAVAGAVVAPSPSAAASSAIRASAGADRGGWPSRVGGRGCVSSRDISFWGTVLAATRRHVGGRVVSGPPGGRLSQAAAGGTRRRGAPARQDGSGSGGAAGRAGPGRR